MQPGTAFLQDNKLRARSQRLCQLQRIAVTVAGAHRRFLGHDDTMADGGVLDMDGRSRTGEEKADDDSPSQEPVQNRVTPDKVGDGAAPGHDKAKNCLEHLRMQAKVIMPEEQGWHECLGGLGVWESMVKARYITSGVG